MKKIFYLSMALLASYGWVNHISAEDLSREKSKQYSPTHEVDNQSTQQERQFSTIHVTSPKASDQVTLKDLNSGSSQTIQSGQDVKVPVGRYQVQVSMEDGYSFDSGEFKTNSTERYDVIVGGYGNIKVSGPLGKVEAYRAGEKSPMTSFSIGEVKTLPIGNYELLISIEGKAAAKTKTLVFSNTTSQVNVR